VKELSDKVARDLIRRGDLNLAVRIVDGEFQASADDQGSSADVWSMRLIRADLLRLRGHTEEALAYLLSREVAFPPDANDLPTLICLKKNRGYCLGQSEEL
jgi:hypothetical protein